MQFRLEVGVLVFMIVVVLNGDACGMVVGVVDILVLDVVVVIRCND